MRVRRRYLKWCQARPERNDCSAKQCPVVVENGGHLDFLSALLHARRLEDQDVTIYPCPICLGLHVGHRQDGEARRRRSIIKELESLERRLRELERDYEEMLGRRNKLAADLQTIEPPDLGQTDLP